MRQRTVVFDVFWYRRVQYYKQGQCAAHPSLWDGAVLLSTPANDIPKSGPVKPFLSLMSRE